MPSTNQSAFNKQHSLIQTVMRIKQGFDKVIRCLPTYRATPSSNMTFIMSLTCWPWSIFFSSTQIRSPEIPKIVKEFHRRAFLPRGNTGQPVYDFNHQSVWYKCLLYSHNPILFSIHVEFIRLSWIGIYNCHWFCMGTFNFANYRGIA